MSRGDKGQKAHVSQAHAATLTVVPSIQLSPGRLPLGSATELGLDKIILRAVAGLLPSIPYTS